MTNTMKLALLSSLEYKYQMLFVDLNVIKK